MNFSEMSDAQFAHLYSDILDKIKEDPLKNFVEAQGFIDVTPTAAQRIILKIAFNQTLDPITKYVVPVEHMDLNGNLTFIPSEMTETEVYKFLTDKEYDEKAFANVIINKINLICGRRSGKTLISAILAIYCAISTNWKPYLKKHPNSTVMIMSHSREFSEEIVAILRELISNSPILTRLINKDAKDTVQAFNLAVPFVDDKGDITYSKCQIKTFSASSKSTRGVAACAVLCDEIAFWNLDENMRETDTKILKAVRPATKQFGNKALLIKLSSPGIKQGVLYNEYEADRKGLLPNTYATFKAPSWVMNQILPLEEFVEEYKLDPEGFDTEYRANFADSMSNFISSDELAKAINTGVTFKSPSGDKGIQYYAAIDAAFKSDRFTFTIVSISENRVIQHVSHGWQGDKKNPVKAHDVAIWIKNCIKDFNIPFIAADQYSFQPLKEIFEQHGLQLREYPFTPKFKKAIYWNLKKLIHSEQIELLDNPILIKEIRELVVEQSSMGTIKISHPMAGSDDFSDSLAVAAHIATENKNAARFEFQSAQSASAKLIPVDIYGTAINAAPDVNMLSGSGHLPSESFDNSAGFGIDPIDGRLKPFSMFIEDQDNDNGDSGYKY